MSPEIVSLAERVLLPRGFMPFKGSDLPVDMQRDFGVVGSLDGFALDRRGPVLLLHWSMGDENSVEIIATADYAALSAAVDLAISFLQVLATIPGAGGE